MDEFIVVIVKFKEVEAAVVAEPNLVGKFSEGKMCFLEMTEITRMGHRQ